MKINIRVKTPKEAQKIENELKNIAKKQVKIGFQKGESFEEDEVDVLDVAAFNEFGTSRAPSRPFMRDSFDKHEKEIGDFVENEFLKVVNGDMTGDMMMKQVGLYEKARIQMEIVDGQFVPNAPYTIKKKGSDKPLIDTGHMRQSVNYVITEKEV